MKDKFFSYDSGSNNNSSSIESNVEKLIEREKEKKERIKMNKDIPIAPIRRLSRIDIPFDIFDQNEEDINIFLGDTKT